MSSSYLLHHHQYHHHHDHHLARELRGRGKTFHVEVGRPGRGPDREARNKRLLNKSSQPIANGEQSLCCRNEKLKSNKESSMITTTSSSMNPIPQKSESVRYRLLRVNPLLLCATLALVCQDRVRNPVVSEVCLLILLFPGGARALSCSTYLVYIHIVVPLLKLQKIRKIKRGLCGMSLGLPMFFRSHHGCISLKLFLFRGGPDAALRRVTGTGTGSGTGRNTY